MIGDDQPKPTMHPLIKSYHPAGKMMDGAIEFIRVLMDDVAVKIWRLFVALVVVVAVCVGSMLHTGVTTPFVCVLVVAVPLLVIEMRVMRVRHRKLRLLVFRVETDSLGSIAAASVGGPECVSQKSLDFKDHAMRIVCS